MAVNPIPHNKRETSTEQSDITPNCSDLFVFYPYYNGFYPIIFSTEQVLAKSVQLLQEGDFARIADFYTSLPEHQMSLVEDPVRCLRAVFALMSADFREIYNLLSSGPFDPDYHDFLQNMWLEAHYLEKEIIFGKNVDRQDARGMLKKHPFPNTISDGEETIAEFKIKTNNNLKGFVKRNVYPNASKIRNVVTSTGLRVNQVNNGFENRGQSANRPLQSR